MVLPRPQVPRPTPGRELGPAQHAGGRDERPFYCRTCQLVTMGRWVPAGWYSIERAPGGAGRHLRLGLYCSLSCLIAAQEALTAGEREYAVRRGLPVDPDRDRARVIDTAQTLLHRGMTIRQIGEVLDVPNSTLRHWLRGIDAPEPAPARGPRPTTAAAGIAALLTTGRDQGKPSVSIVNELEQAGYLATVTWTIDVTGPSHQPDFTVTLTATTPTQIETPARAWTVVGTAATKTAARSAAAENLLTTLGET
jgi:endogenous inhibitor of DNA gyrase (YacG/DUF329 family)